ncbi:MAG: putative DNA-binding domain-containing protein [Saprospiraceae bacterium]|nr:putative DNA-binding domain-containing protein [Saprospiraceae bacterium]
MPNSLKNSNTRFLNLCKFGKGAAQFDNMEVAGIYRTMVIENYNKLCSDCYPLTKNKLGETLWMKLIIEFLASSISTNVPLQEFPACLIEFEKEQAWGFANHCPFLLDALRFEWTQSQVFHALDLDSVVADINSIQLDQQLTFQGIWELLELNYTVFQANWVYTQTPTYLIVYRNEQTLDVENWSITPFMAHLLSSLAQHPQHSIKSILKSLLQQLNISINVEIEHTCLGFIKEIVQKGLAYNTLA